MEYAGYRLSFRQGVHFGSTTVESAEMTFGADRLFSTGETDPHPLPEHNRNRRGTEIALPHRQERPERGTAGTG